MSIIDEIKESFSKGTTLHKLIYLNLGLFLAVQIVRIILFLSNSYELYDEFLRFLAIPSNPEVLARRPWTFITYMFLHEGFLHILFNLLWLYWFGTVFIQELGLKKLLSTYLLGGLAGGILFVLFYNLFPVFGPVKESAIALGASASVMAVVVAAAVFRPERRMHLVLIGQVKIGYIALAMFVLTSLVDFSVNTGGKIAHIGGALTGFLFAYYYRQGKDISSGFDRMMDRMATWFKPGKQKMKVTHKRSANDIEYKQQKAYEQKEVDEILDKISKGGYESLTAREKELLFKMKDKK
ncbi:MAG: rhomboid family intramembrane serine protease [Bacteroidales bacterium]|nr:rhomboid family intramembrane serine protease [Bacteroidales bacterium]